MENYLLQKAPPVFENHVVFTIMAELISKKRPSVPTKYFVNQEKNSFLSFVLVLGFGSACEDLSRFGIPNSLTRSSAPSFCDNRFYAILMFMERDLAPVQGKHGY